MILRHENFPGCVYCSFSNMPRYHIFGMVKSTVLPLIYFCIIMRIYIFSSMGFKKVIFILNRKRKMLSIVHKRIFPPPQLLCAKKQKNKNVALWWFRKEMSATLFSCIRKLPLCPQSQQLNFLLLLLPYLILGRYVLKSKQFLQKDPRIHCGLLLLSF